jgi:hypothetical protein
MSQTVGGWVWYGVSMLHFIAAFEWEPSFGFSDLNFLKGLVCIAIARSYER